MRRGAGLAFGVVLTAAGAAHADPQWNASALTGVCGRGASGHLWQDTCWYNGARADVLLGRNRNSDFAVGPFAQVSTAGFDDLRLTAGGSLLVPATSYFPLVLSLGGYERRQDGWHPGGSAWLFFGSRSYNFHSSYVMAGGLLLGVEQDFRSPRANDVFIGAQIDGLVLALPFLFAYEWIKGHNDDDD